MKRTLTTLGWMMFCVFLTMAQNTQESSAIAENNQHFITDKPYREKVMNVFNERMKLVGEQFFKINRKDINNKEEEALKFLYAYMPLADITDYATDFHLANVKSSFRAQEEMSWGKDVPELLFRHFVLPVRVNNEALDISRPVFLKELRERVKNLSMYNAILEVNHWCHEHVTYQPSDARTLSPLACIKTAIGRCGEESTFTVAALRSIGIPARQVYTPRWAHTDDNHAWVEAWADGKWYFLGACEPEPVLNLGWFNAPASRAMLMHTRVFGDYNGPEEVMLRTSNFTEINLIDNYGSSKRINFKVVDNKGKAVDHARVDFKIYNYAEFCTVATKYTDVNGKTFLSAGQGDMIVWASKDGWFGYAKACFGKDKTLCLRLTNNIFRKNTISKQMEQIDIVPPIEKVKIPDISDLQIANNKLRLHKEDSIRKSYESTFLTLEEAKALCNPIANYLTTARGNWQTILNFFHKHQDNEERSIGLLKSLSNKDLQDITIDILEDNYNAISNQLCPRVENEMIIQPFKQFFENEWLNMSPNMKEVQNHPDLLVKWVKDNIKLNPDKTALRIAQTPVGVWKSRLTDVRSRDIFFVDLARSLNIEARKDPVTSKVQYKQADRWIDVDFESNEQKTAPIGTLVLQFTPNQITDNPKYYTHFTITKILDNGTTQLMNFEEGQVDMGGGTTWSNTFKNGTALDTGTYMLTTGTRLSNGNVLAQNQFFTIEEGKATTLPLSIRYDKDKVCVIGSFDSESKFMKDGNEVSILSQTGRGFFVVGVVGVNHEPTNHALRDIAKEKDTFNQWKRPIVLLFENETELMKYQQDNYGSLPDNIIYGIDKGGRIRQQIAQEMKFNNNGELPIFIIADTFNRVVFSSQGYTIGIGEQMKKTITSL